VLVNSMGDSVQRLINGVQQNTLRFRRPTPASPNGPSSAEGSMRLGSRACRPARAGPEPAAEDRRLAKAAVAMVAGIGADILKFVAAFIIAAIVMAFRRGRRSRQQGDLRAHLRLARGRNSPSCRWRPSGPWPRG
jgi:hypothetical protein